VIPTILAMAVVTFVPRLLGLWLVRSRVPNVVTRFLRFVPVSVFAAIIVPAVPGNGEDLVARVAAIAAAGLAVMRTRQLWAAVVAGMSVFWLLRSL
jgi:branched-subunit amino acid transport protein